MRAGGRKRPARKELVVVAIEIRLLVDRVMAEHARLRLVTKRAQRVRPVFDRDHRHGPQTSLGSCRSLAVERSAGATPGQREAAAGAPAPPPRGALRRVASGRPGASRAAGSWLGSVTSPSSTCRATTRGSCRRSQKPRPSAPRRSRRSRSRPARAAARPASPLSRGRLEARAERIVSGVCSPMWQTTGFRAPSPRRRTPVPGKHELIDHHFRLAHRARTSSRETPSIRSRTTATPSARSCSTAAITCAVP